ncbi:MAG TPA: terminase [Rhodobiaceae bacterium]|nr:terminase [Rhodobiaceae bacterium]
MTKQDEKLGALRALMRQDLSSFIQRSIATVDPGADYLHNWHIDAIAHRLAQIATGEIKRLIITMPPRSLKSISASVAFPAWLLGRDPTSRIVAASYAEGLSDMLARSSMKIIQSAWYRDAFPQTSISNRIAARADFETTRGGGRFSTSIGGTLTGRGGNIVLIDDPHKPEEATSEVKRQAVIDWFRSSLLSRLDDPRSGSIVLIQQRVHEEDLAGFLLAGGGWVHLNLPAIAEEKQRIPLGWRGEKVWKQNELLHAERLPRLFLKQRQVELGSYVFAAQYQQRPAPLEGGLVKWEWFTTYDRAPERHPRDKIVQSWDTASKAAEANDWSVCTTWLMREKEAWLLHVDRKKLEFPALRARIVSHAAQYDANTVLIEDAGSGVSLIQDLKRKHPFAVIPCTPKNDKATRLLSVSHLIEDGSVSIPQEASWLADFRYELSVFPNGKNDDQVDSFSQFLNWFMEKRRKGFFIA